MATPELPEPMNSSPHHSKVKISTTLSDPTFVAGNFVSGKLDMECRADKGLGIGILMVELFAIQGSLSPACSMNMNLDYWVQNFHLETTLLLPLFFIAVVFFKVRVYHPQTPFRHI